MSLVLTNAGEKLEITTTVVIPFTIHYADYVGATPVFTPGVASGDTINGTKDLLAAPGSGQRVVRTISVHNDSGILATITIQLDDGGTNYTIVTVELEDEFSLHYDEDGWKTLSVRGAIATVLFNHNLLGIYHDDATTDAPTRGSMITGNAAPAWDELVHPGTAYHLQTDANDVVWAQNITMAEDAWQGIGVALARLVYNGSDGAIAVMGAYFGVGILAPTYMFDVYENRAGNFAAEIWNDGDNVNRHVLYLRGGGTGAAAGTTHFLYCGDGAGVATGELKTVDGVFQLADISDETKKDNIVDTKVNGLEIINKLKVRDFTWKANPKSPVMTSFIAQEAQKVYPDMVSEFFDGSLGTSRAILIPILTKAIQELDERLTQLEA